MNVMQETSLNNKKILVTGGSGFLGKRLKSFYPNWIYISSSQFDLKDSRQTDDCIDSFKPDSVIHLASKVGGIKYNVENQASIFHENTLINTNILNSCKKFQIKRVLSCLSTCAFPNVLSSYPFTEEEILNGEPPPTNAAYAETKRGLYIYSNALRDQYGLNYSCFTPCNLFGPEDHFGSENSHFIASLINKVSKCADAETLEFWGSGNAMRQHLYVDDLCKIIPILLERHNTNLPLIVAPDENLSIREILKIAQKSLPKNFSFEFNNKFGGQIRKDGCNKELKKLAPEIEFTSFKEGLIKTYNWYINKL